MRTEIIKITPSGEVAGRDMEYGRGSIPDQILDLLSNMEGKGMTFDAICLNLGERRETVDKAIQQLLKKDEVEVGTPANSPIIPIMPKQQPQL